MVLEPIPDNYDIELVGPVGNNNITSLVKHYATLLPSVGYATDYLRNPRVSSVLISGANRVVFDFDVITRDATELEMVVQLALSLDDDGNHPIQVDQGRVVSIDARNMPSGAPGVTLLSERLVSKTITDI